MTKNTSMPRARLVFSAATLVFLAGENAGYITGQVIGQNGGLVI